MDENKAMKNSFSRIAFGLLLTDFLLLQSLGAHLLHLSDDGVGGDAALVLFVTRHVYVAIHTPVQAPAVLHNPELGGRLAAGRASWVWTYLRVVRAARVRFAG
jgi:hypothetical protein